MAPDTSSASAGKKLANVKHWQNLGQNSQVLWGECQGSALYQVRVDLSTFSIQCSCPSRKQPCKHGLGLLLLVANTPSEVPESEPPEWIVAWLAKRAAASKRKETKATQQPTGTPSATQEKAAEKRLAQVNKGIERLDLWLNDLARNGLGSVETQPARFWESQAAQMVDAQAPGLAARIRRMATIPNASSDWPEKLLCHLGQLALLTQAFHRLDQLDPVLQEDVRQLIGWTLKEDEVIARGERVTDEWLILGQTIENIDRGRTQRTWLLGASTRRPALLLQFSFAGSAFTEHYPPGTRQMAELVYWPSTAPQRALLEKRQEAVTPLQERLPGVDTIEAFLADVAATLARHPWRDRFLCTVRDVVPLYESTNNQWSIRDSTGHALPLTKGEHWQLLAVSGGMPVDFAGEWNGESLLPLGILADHKYYVL